MPLMLPTSLLPSTVNVRPISARNELKPSFGGDNLRLARKGTKYAMDVEMPPMDYDEAQLWSDLESESDTVVLAIPQPGITIPPMGTPLVMGAGQAGSSLVIDGVPPATVFGKGWYLSHINTSGRRRLYRSSASATANGSGVITIPLRTMLRASPGDNDVVELALPKIEGYASGDDLNRVDGNWHVGLRFVITERG